MDRPVTVEIVERALESQELSVIENDISDFIKTLLFVDTSIDPGNIINVSSDALLVKASILNELAWSDYIDYGIRLVQAHLDHVEPRNPPEIALVPPRFNQMLMDSVFEKALEQEKYELIKSLILERIPDSSELESFITQIRSLDGLEEQQRIYLEVVAIARWFSSASEVDDEVKKDVALLVTNLYTIKIDEEPLMLDRDLGYCLEANPFSILAPSNFDGNFQQKKRPSHKFWVDTSTEDHGVSYFVYEVAFPLERSPKPDSKVAELFQKVPFVDFSNPDRIVILSPGLVGGFSEPADEKFVSNMWARLSAVLSHTIEYQLETGTEQVLVDISQLLEVPDYVQLFLDGLEPLISRGQVKINGHRESLAETVVPKTNVFRANLGQPTVIGPEQTEPPAQTR